jgi:hypothetical protein
MQAYGSCFEKIKSQYLCISKTKTPLSLRAKGLTKFTINY